MPSKSVNRYQTKFFLSNLDGKTMRLLDVGTLAEATRNPFDAGCSVEKRQAKVLGGSQSGAIGLPVPCELLD